MATNVEERLLADGFSYYEHETLRPGTRVRNRGELFPTAHEKGTAEVIAVLRKPGEWEKMYKRLNLEVVVRRDTGVVTAWADYGTCVVRGGMSE